jgi:hypothetical protein
VYEIKVSVDFSYDTTSSSARIRYTTDGMNWNEYTIEPKDTTDRKTASTFTVKAVNPGDVFDIRVEGACESSSHTLEIFSAVVVLENKA